MAQPRLSFGCELHAHELEALFANPAVTDQLVALRATVCLGLLDLSPERAAVIHQLNRAGVPVVAWLLLPKEQGYWFNADNAPLAAACYDDFQAWTAGYGLSWQGIGIDIEPDFRELQRLLTGRGWGLLPRLVCRAFDGKRIHRAQTDYRALVDRIRADGYQVESYQLPLIADERKAGSTLLQRLLGLVDVPADRELLMLYTSFLRALGPGFLWSYAPDAQGIGIGITGSGVEPEGSASPMTWDEFVRDLRLAQQWTDDLFIYSLEGCVYQDFLGPLTTFDWARPVSPPPKMTGLMNAFRKALQSVLWLSAHPLLLVVGLTVLIWLLSRSIPGRLGVTGHMQAEARARPNPPLPSHQPGNQPPDSSLAE
jgi:hypothetical protein